MEIGEDKKKKSNKLPIEVTEEECTALIEAIPGRHHKICFMIAWESGLRISEVLKLEAKDIDYERGTFFIREGKGCKDRLAGMARSWEPYMERYLPLSKCCSKRALQKAFEFAAVDTGLMGKKPGVHFHSLRHGYATHLAGNNVPIHHIQKLLGHSAMTTTMIYVNLAPTHALEAHANTFNR